MGLHFKTRGGVWKKKRMEKAGVFVNHSSLHRGVVERIEPYRLMKRKKGQRLRSQPRKTKEAALMLPIATGMRAAPELWIEAPHMKDWDMLDDYEFGRKTMPILKGTVGVEYMQGNVCGKIQVHQKAA